MWMPCCYLAPFSLPNIDIWANSQVFHLVFPRGPQRWDSRVSFIFSLLWCCCGALTPFPLACVFELHQSKLCSVVEIRCLSNCSFFLWCSLSYLYDAWNSSGQGKIVLPRAVLLSTLKSLITSVRSDAEHHLLLILGILCRVGTNKMDF